MPKNGGQSFISHENESTEHFLEENLTTTADSCSWVVDEKAGIGDKEITQGKKAGEPQERYLCFCKSKLYNMPNVFELLSRLVTCSGFISYLVYLEFAPFCQVVL